MQSLDWTTMLQFLNLSWQAGPLASLAGLAVGRMSLLTTSLSLSLSLVLIVLALSLRPLLLVLVVLLVLLLLMFVSKEVAVVVESKTINTFKSFVTFT